MVKVSILGATGVIGKNVAFTLARADTVDEIILFAILSSATSFALIITIPPYYL